VVCAVDAMLYRFTGTCIMCTETYDEAYGFEVFLELLVGFHMIVLEGRTKLKSWFRGGEVLFGMHDDYP
jgi:hypothetical protein